MGFQNFVVSNIYKILASPIAPTVSLLFHNSLSEGIFPECFKTAKIIPIFKSGDSNYTANYRPISMLKINDCSTECVCVG